MLWTKNFFRFLTPNKNKKPSHFFLSMWNTGGNLERGLVRLTVTLRLKEWINLFPPSEKKKKDEQ